MYKSGAIVTVVAVLSFLTALSINDGLREKLTAATFFIESISVDDLLDTYADHQNKRSRDRLKILIVPGHEPTMGGTEYGGYTERDIVADIAENLADYFSSNNNIEVIVARDKESWLPELEDYFESEAPEIWTFIQEQIALMQQYVAQGYITSPNLQVHHNAAPSLMAFHLYGINKWASENDIGITLHLHINDYEDRRHEQKYNGFVVYVPEKQYSNAAASRQIGEDIAARLNLYHGTSTMTSESLGVIEDQELIALGSNNTADTASVLIEYGYIYESQFSNPSVRALSSADYAYETYLGVMDFLNDPVDSPYGTNILPYTAKRTPFENETSADVYALQASLHAARRYPPPGKTLRDCPISGYFGPCTKAAIQ